MGDDCIEAISYSIHSFFWEKMIVSEVPWMNLKSIMNQQKKAYEVFLSILTDTWISVMYNIRKKSGN